MSDGPKTKKRSYPTLQALLLADQIYTDHSGKRIICGTFSKILSLGFPSITSFSCFAFVLLVDVVDEVEIRLRLVSLADNEIVMEGGPLKIKHQDPLSPVDLVVQIPPLPLPHAGVYSFECVADGMMIGSVRLQVEKMQEKPQ